MTNVNVPDEFAAELQRFAAAEGLTCDDAVAVLLGHGLTLYEQKTRRRIILTAEQNGSRKRQLLVFPEDKMRDIRRTRQETP